MRRMLTPILEVMAGLLWVSVRIERSFYALAPHRGQTLRSVLYSTYNPLRFVFVNSRTDEKILEATRQLLVSQGVHKLTVEGVAIRSGVAKTTIYRRYRSKHELALAVLLAMVREVVAAVPDLGETRAELVAFVSGGIRILGQTPMGRVMQGLVSDLATDKTLGGAFREQVVAERLAEVRRLLDRGVERGEIRSGADYELVHDLLFGPIYYRLLLSGGPLDEQLAEQIVDSVMASLS
jgi:AcrR family transcriptional regulator